MAIFIFDTQATGQGSRIIKCEESCNKKGRERRKVFNKNHGFENRTED